MPLSVVILISLGRRTKENYCGNSEWFSRVTAHLEALSLKTEPKSSVWGVKVIAFTVKTHRRLNLTGKT